MDKIWSKMVQSQDILFAFLLGVVALPALYFILQPDPIYPRKPRIPSPPPSPKFTNISTPYDETEIVTLITDLYELFIKLNCFSHNDVTWPSEQGHQINEELCRQLNLDDAVISLMKKIPYVNGNLYSCFHLFPRSIAYSFLQDDDIVASRDPIEPEEVQLHYILPHDIALSYNFRDGMALVLDTEDSMYHISYFFAHIINYMI
jgi:hypothetical protein